MRIAILTSGRFHMADLARELALLGHDVRFHSLLPTRRARRWGVPNRCNRWLGPAIAPALVTRRLTHGTRWQRTLGQRQVDVTVARLGARRIEDCDVLIAMSGMALESIRALRKRCGARTFVMRGSRHIVSQQEILSSLPGAKGGAAVPQWVVERELKEYEEAGIVSNTAHNKPVAGLTMSGLTTPAADEASRLGYEVLVFHTTDSGEKSME